MKVRIRWYGNFGGFIQNAVLEFKNKQGLTGIKNSYRLDDFEFEDIFKPGYLQSLFLSSRLEKNEMELMLSLIPTLINRYQRKYYLSFDQKFRITLDRDLSYFPVSSKHCLNSMRISDPLGMIMELKYSQVYQIEATALTQQFLFRVSKNSKYVRGVSIIYLLDEHA